MEGCSKSNGEVVEVRLNTAALSNLDSFQTPISFPSHSSVSSSGLVDSGSSHCFADLSFIDSHAFSSYKIPPVVLHLLDGLVSAIITCTADISVRFSTNDILLLKFYITNLDSSSAFVFGHNWLHRYNPSIDWSVSQILYFRRLLQSVPSSARTLLQGCEQPAMSSPTSSASDLKPSDSLSSALLGNSSSPSVSFINAAAYARLACLKGNTIFTVTISNSDSITGCSANTDPIDLSGIPEDYHKFADVFSKSQASTLPPHRPYDLKIDLKEGAEPPIGRMYSLSETEMTALRQVLDENLRNGFVRPSNSSHGAPILFVKKKDGSLCLDW